MIGPTRISGLHGSASKPPGPQRQDRASPPEQHMDHLTRKEQPDRSKINMHEPFEVKHWTRKLGIDEAELQKAVDKVGNSAAAVRKELGLLGDAHR
jgi:hypothetical protein